ncbi:hypothetical protein CASFOL_013313 [Castilleja foliolosa]|uniref:Uncharacterized protein n=1 Tax=Castilleja foliolosa TaxID=1961234 RepID=A0ABD3DK77_9LAMI
MAAKQSNAGGSSNTWPKNVVNKDGSPANVLWSEEFECYTVNGVLAPLPLSSVPLEDNEATPQPREKVTVSPTRVNVGATQPPAVPSNVQWSRKRSRSTTPGDHPMVFKLSKFLNAREEYLLELRELDTGLTTWSRVSVFEKNRTWEMSINALTSGNHVDVQPLLEDPNPPMFRKRPDLSLQERLVGWLGRTSIRSNGQKDKSYIHQGKKFRSFNQMVIFIIYANTRLKDLTLTAASTAGNPGNLKSFGGLDGNIVIG